ncbi:AraC family transcriptional regulator [Sphingobacterium sp. LRF_L2]|uniref:AraC family transcriptional regulator n=1 Tax=Sphingobacterium sp. LRF_L2 TaxID=3369421 RepID=UPI003F646990
MYIQRLTHTSTSQQAITIRHDQTPQNHNVWHSHAELEFIYIKKGAGTFFVGDSIQPFLDGFIVLIGSNTPHYWLFNEEYLNTTSDYRADIRVIHFKADFLGNDFLKLNEAKSIRQLYQFAQRAIGFSQPDEFVRHFFEKLHLETPLQQLTSLLNVLEYMKTSPVTINLASDKYNNLPQQEDHKRINKILEYIRIHYKYKVKLDDISQVAGMTTNSFCRYFKQKTGKTPVQFINEFRIGQACRLLTETDLTIKEICYDSGFQNFVSFHKIFKEVIKSTPLSYRVLFRK